MRRWLPLGTLVISILVAACSSQGLRLPQSPLAAALERKTGLIAYIGVDGNVYTIDQGGGNLEQLTDDAHPMENGALRVYDFPTWSSQDNRLAYVGLEFSAEGPESASIYATGQDGEDPVEIYSSDRHFPLYLYWSPGGDRISFLSQSVGRTLAMHVASADGSTSSVIDTGRPYYWAWSPQGMEVIAHVGGSAFVNPGGARISLLQLDPEVREIGLGIRPTSFQAPAYSPDGQNILIAGDGGAGQPQLMLTDHDGIIVDSLLDYAGSIAFGWSPNGDYAAYVTGSQVVYAAGQATVEVLAGDLAILDMRTIGETKRIETGAENVVGFFWAPNSKHLAYFTQVVLSGGEEDEQQAQGDQIVGLKLHVAEARSGASKEIGTFLPTRNFWNLIQVYDQYQRSDTIWSPDSNYLVISAIDGQNQPRLFIVPASGNFDARPLAEAVVGIWSWE